LWARRDSKEKSVERVASGKNLFISLGMISGPGAGEWTVLSKVSRVII
jgi:hypothetical protein